MDREKTLAILKKHEGLRLRPYKCPAGRWTWGYGRNLEARPLNFEETLLALKNGPTIELAETMLARDTQEAVERVSWACADYFHDLNEPRQHVLIDMCFNLGIHGLLQFEKTLNLVALGKYDEAADEMLQSQWHYQVGKRSTTLSEMMRSGQWPSFLS